MNDYDVQMLVGNNFEQIGDYRLAEQSYLLTHHMIPNRFIPLYRLAKLYENNNDYVYAHDVAEIIMYKKIKIPSMKIRIIKNEMEELISKYSN